MATARDPQPACNLPVRVEKRQPIPIVCDIFDLIDKFGAEFATDPPCQTALARMVRREDEGELRRDFQVLGDHLHAAGRYVGDGAVARQRTCAALDFCDSSAQTTFASASISKHSGSQYGADRSSGASGIPSI